MFKYLFKGVSAFMTIMVMTVTIMPATDKEKAALGPDAPRFNLVQMRMARAMMNIAPDFVVDRYAEATGLPPDIVRAHLERKAAGEPIVPQSAAAQAPSNERQLSGGAKFIKVD